MDGDPATLFVWAVELYRQGSFVQAEAVLGRILEQQPRHFDAWHLRGVVASQLSRPDRAIEAPSSHDDF